MTANPIPARCPDCHQRTDQPQRPVGYLGAHPVWCATCEDVDRRKQKPRVRRARG